MERKIQNYQPPRKGIQYIIYPETRETISPFLDVMQRSMKRIQEIQQRKAY